MIKVDLKKNAFDFMRLLFAFCVVYAHSRYLYGAPDLLHWNAKGFDALHVGGVGLWGFFAISGFLVMGSYTNSKNCSEFLLKRFKRIFPGFWVSLLVCAFVFAPLWYFIKLQALSGFFDVNALYIWKFITTNLDSAIVTQSIGSVAIDTINGPLWTIHHEISAYIILAFIFVCFGIFYVPNVLWQRRFLLAVTIALTLIRCLYSYNTSFSSSYSIWFGDERFLLFLVVFMWGAVINLYREIVVPHWKGVVISISVLFLGTEFNFLPIVFPIFFTYLVISLCFSIPVKNISQKIGDLSFGVYLYHWPVRLTLQMLGFQESLGMWSFISLNIILTLPFAYLSWTFVEKHFLKHAQIK